MSFAENATTMFISSAMLVRTAELFSGKPLLMPAHESHHFLHRNRAIVVGIQWL